MKALVLLFVILASVFPALEVVAEEMVTVRFVYNRKHVRVLRNADSGMADSGFRIAPGAVLEMKVPKSWIPSNSNASNLDLAALIRKIPTKTPRGGTVDHYYPVRVISSGGTEVPPNKEFNLALASLGWGNRSGNLNSRGSYIVQNLGTGSVVPPMPRIRPAHLGGTQVAEQVQDDEQAVLTELSVEQPAAAVTAAPTRVVPFPLPRPERFNESPPPTPFSSPVVDPGWMTPAPAAVTAESVSQTVFDGGTPSRVQPGVVTQNTAQGEATEIVPDITTASLDTAAALPTLELTENFDVVTPDSALSDRQCTEVLRDQEPFMVSTQTGMGTANWENFRELDESKNVAAYIPLSSIVKVLPQTQPYMGDVQDEDYIPVEVLSTPTADLDAEAPNRSSRAHLREDILNRSKPRAKKGDQGYLHRGSLRPASNYTFVVSSNAPLLAIPGMEGNLRGRPLRLAKVGAKFKVNECCVDNQLTGQRECEDNPVFAVLGENLSDIIGEVAINDDFLCHVRAVASDQVGALKQIADMAANELGQGFEDLQYIDSRGLVKIPLDRETCGDAGMKSVFGSFNYNPDEGCNRINDQFAPPETACALMRVLEDHQNAHRDQIDRSTGRMGGGYEVQFGDMYHPDSWGDHRGHDNGECIDIRPLRKTAGRGAVSTGSGGVDMDKTCELIARFRRAGANTVLFGKKCSLFGTDVSLASDHDDHFHVCLPSNSRKVQETCRNGL